ncbi:ankyrin repeat-containing domain protein [Nemania serpens]|nr:ankyrin repeat-containing domain protein [Nemania serpens]
MHYSIQELVRRGADTWLAGHNGYTALHFVSCRGMMLSVQALLHSSVLAECRTACGRTPLHLSCITLMNNTRYWDWSNFDSFSPFWCLRADRHYQLSELFPVDGSSDQIEGDHTSTSSHVERRQKDQGQNKAARNPAGHQDKEEEEADLASPMPQDTSHNNEQYSRSVSAPIRMESFIRPPSPRHATPSQANPESPLALTNADQASIQPHTQVGVDQHSESGAVTELTIESLQTENAVTTGGSSEWSREALDSDHASSTQTSSLRRVRSWYSRRSLESLESLQTTENANWRVDSLEHADVIELLVEAGADVNSRDDELCAPLHYAALAGDLFLVELLIRRLGADPMAQDGFGRTALHFTCCGFQYGANWVEPDEKGEIIALRRGIIGLLIDRGVDASITDRNGKTALDCARLHEGDRIGEFLQVRTARHALLDPAERMKRADDIEYMVAERLKRDIMWKPAADEPS